MKAFVFQCLALSFCIQTALAQVGATPTPISGRKLSPEIIAAVVTISGPKGDGTGFICTFRGKPFIATNQHVLAAGSPLTIRTSSGETFRATQFLTAADADVTMIQCDSLPASVTPL